MSGSRPVMGQTVSAKAHGKVISRPSDNRDYKRLNTLTERETDVDSRGTTANISPRGTNGISQLLADSLD
jgi:hypothetical protein